MRNWLRVSSFEGSTNLLRTWLRRRRLILVRSAKSLSELQDLSGLECPRQLFSLELLELRFADTPKRCYSYMSWALSKLQPTRTFSSSEHYVPIEPIRIPPLSRKPAQGTAEATQEDVRQAHRSFSKTQPSDHLTFADSYECHRIGFDIRGLLSVFAQVHCS